GAGAAGSFLGDCAAGEEPHRSHHLQLLVDSAVVAGRRSGPTGTRSLGCTAAVAAVLSYEASSMKRLGAVMSNVVTAATIAVASVNAQAASEPAAPAAAAAQS